jgi:hypothetical protein
MLDIVHVMELANSLMLLAQSISLQPQVWRESLCARYFSHRFV